MPIKASYPKINGNGGHSQIRGVQAEPFRTKWVFERYGLHSFTRNQAKFYCSFFQTTHCERIILLIQFR